MPLSALGVPFTQGPTGISSALQVGSCCPQLTQRWRVAPAELASARHRHHHTHEREGSPPNSLRRFSNLFAAPLPASSSRWCELMARTGLMMAVVCASQEPCLSSRAGPLGVRAFGRCAATSLPPFPLFPSLLHRAHQGLGLLWASARSPRQLQSLSGGPCSEVRVRSGRRGQKQSGCASRPERPRAPAASAGISREWAATRQVRARCGPRASMRTGAGARRSTGGQLGGSPSSRTPPHGQLPPSSGRRGGARAQRAHLGPRIRAAAAPERRRVSPGAWGWHLRGRILTISIFAVANRAIGQHAGRRGLSGRERASRRGEQGGGGRLAPPWPRVAMCSNSQPQEGNCRAGVPARVQRSRWR